MACFLIPAAEAVITTKGDKVQGKRRNDEGFFFGWNNC